MESGKFFGNERGMLSVLCKIYIFSLAHVLGTQYFCEILHVSLTVKNSENVLKSRSF